MDFGDAIRTLKSGRRVTREGWNGKGMWLRLAFSGEANVKAVEPLDGLNENPSHWRTLDTEPHIVMKTADNKHVPWLASQTDMLAEDWKEVS